jgi:excisionase family DNA binding protein
MTSHAGQSASPADRLVPPQGGPYWDLDLLTPDDVCALLKVKKSWLYDAVESGALEAIRLGKQLRFRPSALARYLNDKAGNGKADYADPPSGAGSATSPAGATRGASRGSGAGDPHGGGAQASRKDQGSEPR